ncbi:MAG: adenylate/guanylate cyclase domain-containing protein [Actinobacteria bacterium]|nr:adenylate/guanylate cyclase domain-containing protein [Actinomycetota bacterium]
MTEAQPNTQTGSILFTDLVGFTEFNDAVGDIAAVDVLDQQVAMARDILCGHGHARIVKELGDGLMLWFDGARCAVEQSMRLLKAIEGARDAGDFPLSIRMGLHRGPAVVRGSDLAGQTINIGARVADLAGPGELLATDDAVTPDDLDRAGLRSHPVGPVQVKGVSSAIWIQRIEPN